VSTSGDEDGHRFEGSGTRVLCGAETLNLCRTVRTAVGAAGRSCATHKGGLALHKFKVLANDERGFVVM
jgi:hypothetical protein